MKRSVNRWLAPMTIAVGGTIVAGAVAIGHTWGDALIAEVVTSLLSVVYFLLTGSRSDLGAIYGHHADERQRLVYLRANALALRVMLLAAFVCAVITVAMNKTYWQADVIGSVGGLSFVLGLAGYGAASAEQGEADAGDSRATSRSNGGVMS